MELSRRHFLQISTTAAASVVASASATDAQTAPGAAAAGGAPAPRGFDPADPALRFDLVIAGGEVVDPSQRLRGRRDIGIKHGQIAALAPGIAADRSRRGSTPPASWLRRASSTSTPTTTGRWVSGSRRTS